MIWILAILILATSAQADVTRKHRITSQFMGANESTTADYYSGDRNADESTVRWTRGFMKTMTGGKPAESGTIVRLDKELVWSLDPKKKTYTEMTFAEYREMIRKASEEMQQAEGEEEVADTTAEDMYEWTVEDKSEAEPKTINGWACRNAHVVATGVNKQAPEDKVIITVNMWNSTEVPGAEEITAFYQRYLKALGIDEMALTPGMVQAALLYQKKFDEVMQAAKKAPGEPVQSLIEIKRNQPKGPNVGEAIKEGAASEVMSKLPFGKKKAAPKEEPVQYELKVKFSVQSELTEATTTAVDAAKFEVPANYKLKKK